MSCSTNIPLLRVEFCRSSNLKVKKTKISIVPHDSSPPSLSSSSRSRPVLLLVIPLFFTYRPTQPLSPGCTFFGSLFRLHSTLQTCKPTEGPLCPVAHCIANTVSFANDVDHGAVVVVPRTYLTVAHSRINLLSPHVFTSAFALRYACFLGLVPWPPPPPPPGPAYTLFIRPHTNWDS